MKKSIIQANLREGAATDLLDHHPSKKAIKLIEKQSEMMMQSKKRMSSLENDQKAPKNGSITKFQILNNAEESIRFRSKLEHFKQMTTEQYKVFNKGNAINARL